VESAIALATVAPRQAIGLTGMLGKSSAQLLRWHLDESTGKLIWQRLASQKAGLPPSQFTSTVPIKELG
jgi:N-acetylglucosamine-6-phosphate deacetylase